MKYNRYNKGEELQRTQLTVLGQGRMSCAIKKCPSTVRTEVTTPEGNSWKGGTLKNESYHT